MNAAASLTLVSALVAIVVGVRSHRVALAPGSAEQRWFTVVVLASAGYALLQLPSTLPASAAVVTLAGGPKLSLLAVLTWGWIRFSQEFAEVAPGRPERLVSTALLAATPALAAPGVLFLDRVNDLPFAPLGVVYRLAAPSPVGAATMLVLLLLCAAVLVRLVRAARRGVRHAVLVSVGFGTMLAFAAWDAAASVLARPNVPFVLAWGFAPAVLAVGWMNTSRLVEATHALELLRARLASEVALRTGELSAALERLHESEKLLALGRFANGFAHQVNNPAAVVTASLGFLADRAGPRLAPEELDALGDARAATDRITYLVRRLVDAAQLADARPGLAVSAVPAAISNVIAREPACARDAVHVHDGPAAGACVRMRPDALEAVIETLLRNALGARPATTPRRVDVAVERVETRVRITVADHGAGLTPEALGRAFDPFFSTAAPGSGSVVGLAVARGLAQANGGTLALESTLGAGTRAILELPEERAAEALRARRW